MKRRRVGEGNGMYWIGRREQRGVESIIYIINIYACMQYLMNVSIS